jgi:hypothetical protein
MCVPWDHKYLQCQHHDHNCNDCMNSTSTTKVPTLSSFQTFTTVKIRYPLFWDHVMQYWVTVAQGFKEA